MISTVERDSPRARGDGAGGAPAAPARRAAARAAAAPGRDDRGAGRGARRRRARRRGRFLRDRHQRPHPVHARRSTAATSRSRISTTRCTRRCCASSSSRSRRRCARACRSASAARWRAIRALPRCCWASASAICRWRRATSRGSSSASAASTWSRPRAAPAPSWTSRRRPHRRAPRRLQHPRLAALIRARTLRMVAGKLLVSDKLLSDTFFVRTPSTLRSGRRPCGGAGWILPMRPCCSRTLRSPSAALPPGCSRVEC